MVSHADDGMLIGLCKNGAAVTMSCPLLFGFPILRLRPFPFFVGSYDLLEVAVHARIHDVLALFPFPPLRRPVIRIFVSAGFHEFAILATRHLEFADLVSRQVDAMLRKLLRLAIRVLAAVAHQEPSGRD